jgi:hypothetical protein
VKGAFRADKRLVGAAEKSWRPLGELLVHKGLVTPDELGLALAEQEETGRLLGAILVERGFVSGPTLAVALAEQYGVELDQQRGFGTGLWAEIDRRHRQGRGAEEEEDESEGEEATVFKLEPVKPALEAVPDPEPELDRLQAENRRLQDEIARLHEEFTQLRVVEAPEPASSHLLFVPTPARYLVVERQGPPPESGAEVEVDGDAFTVGKLGRAPFPGERRPCAFLLVR